MMKNDPLIETLWLAAERAAQRAYAPYSKLHVGAAVLSAAGHVYTGANIENASYPLSLCAERSAIAVGIATEGPDFRLTALAVAARHNENWIAASPCGGCRQVIAEFGADAIVHYHGTGLKRIAMKLAALLPEQFHLDR